MGAGNSCVRTMSRQKGDSNPAALKIRNNVHRRAQASVWNAHNIIKTGSGHHFRFLSQPEVLFQ